MGAPQEMPTRSLFREVNDRVAELGRGSDISLSDVDIALSLICECGNASCGRRIELTLGEYEGVREDEALVILSPAHLPDPRGQLVVADNRYLVVRSAES
jgi:hypothetical protein